MSAQVLVVDDSAEFARRAAAFIAARTGLATDFAITPDAARAALERQPVAVAVLDQKMPLMSGTDLFLQLRAVRPSIRALMLTGEAEPDEVGAALKLGYHDYLPKSRISDLPQRVAVQYLDYMISTAEDEALGADLVWPRRLLARLFRRIEIQKVAVVETDAQFVPGDSWTTVLQLNAGEERRFSYHRNNVVSATIEHESQRALRHTLRLRTRALAAAMDSIAAASTTVTSRRQAAAVEARSDRSERTFSLPEQEDPAAPDSIRARHFQQAPVFKKIVVTLRIQCKRCGLRNLVPIVVLADTGLVATRHQDYLNNGSVQVFDTGKIPVLADAGPTAAP